MSFVEDIFKVGDFVESCPQCDGDLIVRQNKSNGNLFAGCTNFSTQSCRFTKKIESCYMYRSKLVCYFIENNFNINISDIVYTWQEDEYLCLRVIRNEPYNDDLRYINSIFDNNYYNHKKDNRSSLEFIQNVMLGWLIEDALYIYLKNKGYNISLNGSDKIRVFKNKPTNDPDFKMILKDEIIYLEQITDYAGYWKKYKNITLRDNKYLHLKQNNIFVFGIDLKNNSFILFNVLNRKVKYKFVEKWNKYAYFVELKDSDFHPLRDIKNIDKYVF